MPFLKTLLTEVIDLVYPRTCAACTQSRPVQGGIFCIDCLAELPETGFHLTKDNPFEMHFWGRVPIIAGSAFLFFVPQGRTQKLLHHIKYQGRSDFAQIVGYYYGRQLKTCERFQGIDLIIPVPLHWRKERKRGFNQSAEFGKGLAESMSIPILKKGLIRKRFTQTQTRKTREERVRNLSEAFEVRSESHIQGKHILLVDDVLTTGATLEACALALTEVEGVRISLATIACGRM